MKIIAVEDGDICMYFCGFRPDKQSKNKEEIPHLCYTKENLAVIRYKTEEDLLVDLYRLQKMGINAFTETLEIGES